MALTDSITDSTEDSTEETILFCAPVSTVWEALTQPEQVRWWMAEPEMELEIDTTWCVGSPITIRGFHHIHFENRGVVLRYEPMQALAYNYMSSLSNLPQQPENYTELDFRLYAEESGTRLVLTMRNFPTDVIRKHVELYWRPTLVHLKRYVERTMTAHTARAHY